MSFFCKQKTAYELRISDWSSDVCSSDLALDQAGVDRRRERGIVERDRQVRPVGLAGLGPRRAQLVVAGQHPVIGALVAGLVVRDELDLDVDVEGADGARVAVLGLAEGADGGHGVSPSVCQVAPIAALTAIGQATAGRQHRLRPQRSGGPASAKNLWARKAARRGYC